MNERKKPACFPTTSWSLLRQVDQSNSALGREALDQLLREYMPALKGYLVQARRISLETADDLLQGFIAEKVIAGRIVNKADRTRGKFRNFLLKSLNNYISTQFRTQTRRYSFIDQNDTRSDTLAYSAQADAFDVEWASQVVRAALQAMENECKEKSRLDVWRIFACRVVKPAFGVDLKIPYEDLVRQFDLASPRQAINLLVTAKRMFVRCLHSEVGRYVERSEDIEAEICDLRGILLRTKFS